MWMLAVCLLVGLLAPAPLSWAGPAVVDVNRVGELTFTAKNSYADPYNDVTLDAVFTAPTGGTIRVPAFWAGDKTWKVRFSAREPGVYRFITEANVTEDAGLHGQTGQVTVKPASSDNPLYAHGRIRAAADKRHFEHADGTPFFWLGDTWWMGLSTRLKWPKEFKELAADRVKKGFNVIQIITGPYPDMDAWDPRGRSDSGFPFTKDFASINPEYYNLADKKFTYLVDEGLMPCIVGMWGYYLPQLGVDKARRYWRYLIARYGAYPVTWCIAGEATMPYYLSETKDQDKAFQKDGWTEVMRYVRETDPFHNVIGIHPILFGRDQVHEPALMDFDMLQTGHSDLDSVPNVINTMRKALEREPRMPVVNSEVNYEGILGRAWQNVQRLCFYHSVMNGAAGYTYGANGIWQFNTREKPYGPSPHGRSWGNMPWQDAAQLPGSSQVGYGGALWRRLPWWELERRPEWAANAEESDKPYGIVCVGIPRRLRIVYAPLAWNPPALLQLEPDVRYHARYFDPVTGQEIDLGEVTPDAGGKWTAPLPPEVHDWLLIAEARQP